MYEKALFLPIVEAHIYYRRWRGKVETTYENIGDMEITTKNLCHLGIIAKVFDEPGISEALSEKISKNKQKEV